MKEDLKNGVQVTVLPAVRPRVTVRPASPAEGGAAPWAGVQDRPWAATGSVEVEALAVWAYRDQRVDRHLGAGLYAAEASAAGLEPNGRSADGCAAIADIAHMGARIDRSSGLIRDGVHPVADAVAFALADIRGGELVAYHAGLGGRPDGWREPKRWYRPTVWVKPGVEGQAERTGRGTSPMFCRVIPTVTREELVRRRAHYALWWEALGQLAWALSFKRMGFIVSPPSAPAEPWLEPELPLLVEGGRAEMRVGRAERSPIVVDGSTGSTPTPPSGPPGGEASNAVRPRGGR